MTAVETRRFREALEASSRGNTVAFHEVYSALHDRVFAYVRSRLTTRDDALDCTQQVFVELWKSLPRFTWKSEPQFYGFLFTIVKRRLIVFYHNAKQMPEALPDEENLPSDTKETGATDTMIRALDTLDERDREIITLHHWSRYTFGEIGAMLNMSESAVRVRHHRALKTLKTTLESSL